MGAKLIGYGCILELAFLNPREKLTPSDDDVDVYKRQLFYFRPLGGLRV